MKYSNNKDINCFVRRLIKHGCTFVKSKKHGVLFAPQGQRTIVPSTPSDIRAYMNFKKDVLRRMTYAKDQ